MTGYPPGDPGRRPPQQSGHGPAGPGSAGAYGVPAGRSGPHPHAVGQPQQPQAAPVYLQPLPKRSETSMTVVTICVMVLAALLLAGALVLAMLQSDLFAVVIAIAAAVVPLTVVWLVVRFIDRWEPEPRRLIFGALLWGGGIAVAAALIASILVEVSFPGLPAWVGPVVQAPLVEEFWKGLGVLVLCFAARRHVNGPTDGIVLGALIGAGFAFTENVLYFSRQFYDYGAFGLIGQFVIRGIALPLLHPICTSLTGYAIGRAAQRGGTGRIIGAFFIGLVPAAFVHFLWNAGVTLGPAFATTPDEQLLVVILVFGCFMLPIFIAWILLLVRQGRHDRRVVRERLGDYARAGWYAPAEIEMLSTMAGRSNARRWAARQGPRTAAAMREFIHESTRLAHVRDARVRRPGDTAAVADEERVLRELNGSRAELVQAQRQAALPGGRH